MITDDDWGFKTLTFDNVVDDHLLLKAAKNLSQEQRNTVQVLDLESKGIKHLSGEFITMFPNLTEIYLFGNQLSTLPHEIGYTKNLRLLSVRNNNIRTLPSTMTQLTKLHHLFLDDNFEISRPQNQRRIFSNQCYLYDLIRCFERPRHIGTLLVAFKRNRMSPFFANIPKELVQDIVKMMCQGWHN